MKKLINTTLLLACLAGTGFISSCSKSDKGGTCPVWYESTNCQTEMRTKFYGTYKGTAHEPDGGSFDAIITLSAGIGGVQNIHLEWGIGNDGKPTTWDMILTGSNTVNIPLQYINNNPVVPGQTYSDQGTGTLNSNTLTLQWVAKGITTPWTVNWTLIATKQ